VIGPVKEEFERLFGITFNQAENAKFINHVAVMLKLLLFFKQIIH
jgi:hypothetical protein